MSPMTKEGIDN